MARELKRRREGKGEEGERERGEGTPASSGRRGKTPRKTPGKGQVYLSLVLLSFFLVCHIVHPPPPSLSPSLTPSFPPSLPPSLPPFLSPSLTQCLPTSHPPSRPTHPHSKMRWVSPEPLPKMQNLTSFGECVRSKWLQLAFSLSSNL